MDRIISTIQNLYLTSDVLKIEDISSGYGTQNKIVFTKDSKYFLKKYESTILSRIIEIHKAYSFFSSKNIPVVKPLINKNNQDFVEIEGFYYALFPYIEGITVHRDNLTETQSTKMGETLAKMHLTTINNVPDFITAEFKIEFDYNTLFSDLDDLKRRIVSNKFESINDTAIKILDLKHDLVSGNKETIKLLVDPGEMVLSHRDFHERNLIFGNDGVVIGICDLDKVCRESRYTEISRTLMFSCFGGTFEERNFNLARCLLNGYISILPTSRELLKMALRRYIFSLIFSLWTLKQYYEKNNHRVSDLIITDDYPTSMYMKNNLETFLDRTVSFWSEFGVPA